MNDRKAPADAKALVGKLESLTKLTRAELLDRFRKLYGCSPSVRLSSTVLRLAIAYKLQEQVYGGLNPSIRRALLSGKATPAMPASTGTVLIREWRGKEHAVMVHADYVDYAGERFRSLTEVALRITGQKRSGPAFFGLRGRPHA